MPSLYDLLDSRNFCQFNRTLAVEIGMVESILLCELISSFRYYSQKNELTTIKGEEGFFFETAEKIFQRTGMKVDMQQAARKRLVEKGFIETRDHGLPCKKYYRINEKAISEIFKENSTRIGNSRNKDRELPIQESGTPDTRHYIYEPKDEPKEDNKSRTPKRGSVPSADAEGLAVTLLSAIKKTKPDAREPNLQSWSKEFDRMLRIDKIPKDRICRVIAWLPSNDFWRKNILSAEKFREKFDRLEIEISSSKEADWIRVNTAYFFAAKKDSPPGLFSHIALQGTWLVNGKNSKELQLKLEPKVFEERFPSFAGVKHG